MTGGTSKLLTWAAASALDIATLRTLHCGFLAMSALLMDAKAAAFPAEAGDFAVEAGGAEAAVFHACFGTASVSAGLTIAALAALLTLKIPSAPGAEDCSAALLTATASLVLVAGVVDDDDVPPGGAMEAALPLSMA